MAADVGKMVRVYLGLGSNIEPEKHLRLAIQMLGEQFGELVLSNVYRSRPAGFDGDDFLNLVVGFDSVRSPEDIHDFIESVHAVAGRQRGESRFAPRKLDIDLLLYGDLVLHDPPICVPRRDILEYSFVLGPLAEIAPGLRHPESGILITEYWDEFDQDSHPLTIASVTPGATENPHA